MLQVACVQLSSTADVPENLRQIEALVREAAARGAELIALPEAAEFMAPGAQPYVDHACASDDSTIRFFADLAKEVGRWILVGSLSLRADDGRVANRSHLFDSAGALVTIYDKIHLFDVTLPDGQSHRESDIYVAGDQAVLANSPWGLLGLTICYDIRFPLLYRQLAQAGAKILFIPAAFTPLTGDLHWETLIRARAIETGCYVVAPAQCGSHGGDLHTHGHSLIVDPWGRILADGGDSVGIISAEIDLSAPDEFRRAIPAPSLERSYAVSIAS